MYPRNRPWKPIGLLHAVDPTLSVQSAHSWRRGPTRLPRCTPQSHFLLFLVFFSVRGLVNPQALLSFNHSYMLKTDLLCFSSKVLILTFSLKKV
jgi:hypothetical protein